jgi:hypothetical protein
LIYRGLGSGGDVIISNQWYEGTPALHFNGMVGGH